MPICVECGSAVSDLYREFSKGNIRLTQCHRCSQFADRYVEYEFVVIFIDMVLHKPQVYRHLLFNRISYFDSGFDGTLAFLQGLWLVFDAGFRWLMIYADEYGGASINHIIKHMSWQDHGHDVLLQMAAIFCALVLETIAFHIGVLLAIRFEVGTRYAIVKYNYVTMALTLSSFAKSILIPMLIWDYHDLAYLWIVNVFVASSNMLALSVFLNVQHRRAFLLVLAGWFLKVAMQFLVHLAAPWVPMWWLY